MTHACEVHGLCDPAFEGVRAAFERNFSAHGDVGAAVAIAVDGEIVVDLWGGFADEARSRPWRRETRPCVWSTTKGIAALCFAILRDRGSLSYEDAVAKYWPAFGANGKSGVTIAQLLSHQAGLCGFATPAVLSDYLDQATAAERLAAQSPFWPPGAQSGYHALSIGNLANALFERIEGRTLAQFVAEELAGAYDLEVSIGLPPEWDECAAEMIAPPALSSETANSAPSVAQQAALANPVLNPLDSNGTPWRRASLPSANGFATARALAAIYGALANGGVLQGRRLVGEAAIDEATRVRIAGMDAVLGVDAVWTAGFLRNIQGVYGDSDAAFGHSGWGGSFGFADPGRKMSVAYVMNAMGLNLMGDPRAVALVGAALSARS